MYTDPVFRQLGLCLEAFFYGIYSAIFIMYLRYHAKNGHDRRKNWNILFCAICVLYLLSFAIIILDIVNAGISLTLKLSLTQERKMYITYVTGFILFGCCDFIAQSILIYRCWIVWGRNIRVVIIPIILVFAFIVTWIASIAPLNVVQIHLPTQPKWSHLLLLFSLVASMAVNTLVTSLIVFQISKVFRATRIRLITFSTNGSKLRSIIFVLIESGMALFCIQVARMTVTIYTDMEVYDLFVGIHQMLNGLTPTIILVRVSMGLSFHDEKTMADATSMHFQIPTSALSENESTNISSTMTIRQSESELR